MILVGNHAQLPTICHCHLSNTKHYCQKYYVYNAIDWNFTTYHILKTSIRHVEDLEYIYINVICCRTPTKEKNSSILKLATLMKNK